MKHARLIVKGVVSPAGRKAVERALDDLWEAAEKRLTKQMKEEEK